MKKLIVCTTSVALLAGSAFAASTTIAFESAEGVTQTATFVDDGTVTSEAGDAGTYTYEEEGGVLCIEATDYSDCITFAEPSDEVGASSAYTTDSGGSGTATVVSKED
ncbi:MAG: hypothetical protein RLN72_09485 [Henriciella sp.]